MGRIMYFEGLNMVFVLSFSLFHLFFLTGLKWQLY
jgi:hypothetical protein